MITTILQKVKTGEMLTTQEALSLLRIDNTSADFYALIATANEIGRQQFQNRGYIFAQIGLNAAPCSGNCKFCSMSHDSFSIKAQSKKSKQEVLADATQIIAEGCSALFLMTTADYDFAEYIEIAKAVKSILPSHINMVANVGDFTTEEAQQLQEVGFHGVYHIVRLKEGVDTAIPVATRVQTLDAIKEQGLELYYCVEPIGVEHTYEEILAELERARNYQVNIMAVMRRVNVPGGVFAHLEEVSDLEMMKIASVAQLFVRPKISMNVHETLTSTLLCGVNQLYAEYGANPRDNEAEAQDGRALSVASAQKLLKEFRYICG